MVPKRQPGPALSFIVQDPSSTARQRNLELSDIRSHAARAAHQKRKLSLATATSDSCEGSPPKALVKPVQRHQQRKRKAESDEAAAKRQVAQSLTRTYHGSSDPFNSSTFNITPRLNALIAFVRDVYIPAVYVTPAIVRFHHLDTLKSSVVDQELVMGARHANQDRLLGQSPELLPIWLSSHLLAIMSHIPQNLQLQMRRLFLEFYGPRLKRIRDGINKSDLGTLQYSDIWFVTIFFRVACIENERVAAMAHAQALELSKRVVDPVAELQIYLQLMFTDASFALAMLRRTHLHPQDVIHNGIRRFWVFAEEKLPPAPGWDQIPTFLDEEVFRTALKRTRRALTMGISGMSIKTPTERAYADIVYVWLATTGSYDVGALINRYLDLIEYKTEEMSDGKRQTYAALCMTLCYVIRKGRHACEIDGVDFRDLSHVLVPRLETILRQALKVSTAAEAELYREAWLWMAFLGAQYDERVRIGIIRDAAFPSGWFEDTVVNLMRKMQITEWADVKVILQKYVHMDFLAPEPETFFESTIRPWQIPSPLSVKQVRNT